MKSTGIVRRVDGLGRIVIPKEMRSKMGLDTGEAAEFYVEGDKVILKKYVPDFSCRLCGNEGDLLNVDDVLICKTCINNLAENYFVNDGK